MSWLYVHSVSFVFSLFTSKSKYFIVSQWECRSKRQINPTDANKCLKPSSSRDGTERGKWNVLIDGNMHSSNTGMAVITQCPLSFHGLSGRAQQKLTRQAYPSTFTTKNKTNPAFATKDRDYTNQNRSLGIKSDSTARFKANQLHCWQAILEICLTWATLIPTRLSFRVYLPRITRQTAAGGQLCARRHVASPNYLISMAAERADARFSPSV